MREKHIEFMFNTAHCVPILPQAKRLKQNGAKRAKVNAIAKLRDAGVAQQKAGKPKEASGLPCVTLEGREGNPL